MAKQQSSLHVLGVSVLMVLLCNVNYSLCEKIKTYKLTRGSLTVTFTNYGAVMTSLLLPDRHGLSFSIPLSSLFLIFLCFKSDFLSCSCDSGKQDDVVLGFDTVDGYKVISFF